MANPNGNFNQLPYNWYANQANTAQTYTIHTTTSGGIGSVLGGPYLAGAGGYVQTTSNPNHTHTGYAAVIPNPTGIKMNIIFTDANGFNMPIFVDAAYANIVSQISMQHGQINYLQQAMQPAPPHHKMVEGDFSLDEIAQAEEIMENLRA